jgi:hypothetical protein
MSEVKDECISATKTLNKVKIMKILKQLHQQLFITKMDVFATVGEGIQELNEVEMAKITGGFNPQPDPPGITNRPDVDLSRRIIVYGS